MPPNRNNNFKNPLQKGNRVTIPKLMRWQFKMETEQVLKVGVWLPGSYEGWQFFYAKMDKKGRVLIPLVTLELISREKKPDLAGQIFDLRIEPA